LILGCTHYPFLAGLIRKAVGPGVAIVDPAEETAVEAAEILRESGMLGRRDAEPVRIYYTTGSPEQFAELGSLFSGSTVSDVYEITWGSDLGAIEWQEKTVERTASFAQ
jgi:glutamate racemase